MDLDRLLKLWQDQDEQIVISGDLEAAGAAMRQNGRKFVRGVFRQYLLEIGVGLFVACIFGVVYPKAAKHPEPLYAASFLILCLCAFFVADLLIQWWKKKKLPGPVSEELAYYLYRVEHHQYLLKNVFWWYLLPGGVAGSLVVHSAAIEMQPRWWGSAICFALSIALIWSVMYGVYRLNIRAIETLLEPRRQALKKLLAEFDQAAQAGDVPKISL